MSQQIVIAGPGLPQALGVADSPTFANVFIPVSGKLSLDGGVNQEYISNDADVIKFFVAGTNVVKISNGGVISTGINPVLNAFYDVGGINLAWRNAYFNTVTIGNVNGGRGRLISPSFDILELNNGTAAQEFRIYNTDNGANDEFLSIGYKNTPNVLTIESEATGTGTIREIEIKSKTYTLTTFDGLQGTINLGGSFIPDRTGVNNTGMGINALLNTTTGQGNVAVGTSTLQVNTIGNNNLAVGSSALLFNNGSSNTGIGTSALFLNTTGSSNMALGAFVLSTNSIGSNNTAVGAIAGLLITGSNNTLLGYRVGDNITTASNSLLLGYDIDAQSITASNQMSIGNLLFSEGIDGVGTTISSGNIGVATPTPIGRFAIGGDNARPFTIQKSTVAVVAPTAGHGMLRWEVGTNAGTLKVVAYSGTSTTGVTIADNIGAGN